MITWAIAYAVAHGASQNWFWLAIPVDFVLLVTVAYQIKECARYLARRESNNGRWESDFSGSVIPKVG